MSEEKIELEDEIEKIVIESLKKKDKKVLSKTQQNHLDKLAIKKKGKKYVEVKPVEPEVKPIKKSKKKVVEKIVIETESETESESESESIEIVKPIKKTKKKVAKPVETKSEIIYKNFF